MPCVTNDNRSYNSATPTYTSPSIPSTTNYVNFNYNIQYQINIKSFNIWSNILIHLI